MANSTMAHDAETHGMDARNEGGASSASGADGASGAGGALPPDPKGFHWRFRDVGKVSPVLTWSELRALANAGVVTDQHLLILVESNMTLPVGAFGTLRAGRGAIAVVPAPASGKMACRACEKEMEMREFRESTSHPGSYTAACNACVERHRQDRDKAVEMLPMSLRQMTLMQTAVTGTPRRGLRGLMDAGDVATWETRSGNESVRQNAAEVIVADNEDRAGEAERNGMATMMMVPAEPTTLEAVDREMRSRGAAHPLFRHAPGADAQAGSATLQRRGWVVPALCVLGGAVLAVVVMVLMRNV